MESPGLASPAAASGSPPGSSAPASAVSGPCSFPPERPRVSDVSSFPTEEESLLDFFPATRADFVCRAGDVASVRREDFENVHRARHLLSFQRSMQEWSDFDPDARNNVDAAVVADFTRRLLERNPQTTAEFSQCCAELRKGLRAAPSKAQIIAAYEALTRRRPAAARAETEGEREGEETRSQAAQGGQGAGGANATAAPLPRNRVLENLMKRKATRTNSGVLVITVLTSPGRFSCPHNCHYCPNEPGQPRSYLSTEPAVLRANQNGWDAVRQFHDRAATLHGNGHTVDKIEVLVLGGTWSGYPSDYQEEFIRDLFYAANVFNTPQPFRPKLALEEEQTANESAECRIIGLTLETRPDFINRFEIRKLRRFGCTRVQLGLQHVEDEVLAYINRGCQRRDAIRAIRLLKDSGYKVDIHIMPDLPSSTVERDLRMFFYLLGSADLQADQWKLYPCEVTPFSEIERWYSEGTFVPYAEKDGGRELIDLLLRVKAAVHPWIRLNRVVRDIPNQSIIAGNNITNLRQMLATELEKRCLTCRCIRCREVKDQKIDVNEKAVLKVREYPSNGGQELFLSFETEDEATIFGFLRLRLCWRDPARSKKDVPFACLAGAALLRELHVYGSLVAHGEGKMEHDSRPQHAGLGRRLMQAAEIIAMSRGFFRMAIIAGVGTREYYRKNGYELRETYMVKDLSPPPVGDSTLLGLPLPCTITIVKVPLEAASDLLLAPLPEPSEPKGRGGGGGRKGREKPHARKTQAPSSAVPEDGRCTEEEKRTKTSAKKGRGQSEAGAPGGERATDREGDALSSWRRGSYQLGRRCEVLDVAETVENIRKEIAERQKQGESATLAPNSTTYVDPDNFEEYAKRLYPEARGRIEGEVHARLGRGSGIVAQIQNALNCSRQSASTWWSAALAKWHTTPRAAAFCLGLASVTVAAGMALTVSRGSLRRL
ncbi:elongator complex protein ELP3 [Besnoitia besnoiti]|uniref:tRNA carboxymethyluridine synthase n=1 Tax=Besnoitia besnoiti TaxID=94643 RepID=A0A2A9M3D5_BESBE|nr:elongator complex protein ELP3 [Besnoitia besnoiti]PFH32449.1 elongator complex protein ELP3 [Besnoitia besnoiti]